MKIFPLNQSILFVLLYIREAQKYAKTFIVYHKPYERYTLKIIFFTLTIFFPRNILFEIIFIGQHISNNDAFIPSSNHTSIMHYFNDAKFVTFFDIEMVYKAIDPSIQSSIKFDKS